MWSVCVLLAFAGTARLSLNAQQPNPDNTSYSSSAEDYARSHNVESLTFSAIPQNADPARDRWHKVASPQELQSAINNANNTASVTLCRGKTIYVDATFQNQFGDSTLRVRYCFRPDGTLSQLHSRLKSFHGGMRVDREMAFDESGHKISNQMQSFDLENGQPTKLAGDFWDFPPPLFLHQADLPFAKALP
jgi:hypothetical protein